MAKAEFLSQAVQDLVRQADPIEIVIGVLTFNNAATIEPVVKSIADGVQQHFPGNPALLVNCDAGSQDGTKEKIQQASGGAITTWLIEPPPSTTYSSVFTDFGVPRGDLAVRSVFAVADELAAKMCLLIDGSIRSVTPDWIGLLGRPVSEHGVDCVVPLYRRRQYDGTLTNGLIYPLSRALYGKRVRFPSGGGYGFSSKWVSHAMSRAAWDTEIARYGVDCWMTTTAIAEGFHVCHAFLGPRVQETRPGGADLSGLLAQAVGCVYHLMEKYQTAWETAKGSTPVPVFGPRYEPGSEKLPVHVERMVNSFRQGVRDLLSVWEHIMAPDTLSQVLSLGIEEAEEFRFPMDLWVQTVYDFALAYHDKVLHREHLLKALTPLYLGWTAALIIATRDQGPETVERSIEALCERFEHLKPYLTQRWRWQDE